MDGAQPFPPLLKWTLQGSIAIGSISLLMQLIGIPMAIWSLVRRSEYRSPANIAMTVLTVLPWAVIIVGVVLLFMGIGHFHI